MNKEQKELFYYEKNLKQLRIEAKHFSQKYPSHGTHLGMNNTEEFDPLLERLLEGVSYISGKIEEKIDAYEKETFQAALLALYPSLFMPIPSKTIVECYLPTSSVAKEVFLPKGSVIKIPCKSQEKEEIIPFTTLMPLWIKPISISNSTLDNRELLKIQCTVKKGADLNSFTWNTMRFFFNSDKHTNKKLFYALNCLVEEVTLSWESFSQTIYLGDAQCIGFMIDRVNDGYDSDSLICRRNLMVDYHYFFQRYQFFYLKGLDKVHWPEAAENFTIQIKFKESIEEGLLGKLLLWSVNSVPAINLFQDNAEPILYDNRFDFLPVCNDFGGHESKSIYRINSVSAISLKDNRQTILNQGVNLTDEKKPYYLCQINLKNTLPVFELSVKGLSKQEKYALAVETIAYNSQEFSSIILEEFVSSHHEKIGKLHSRILIKPTAIIPSLLRSVHTQEDTFLIFSKNFEEEESFLKELQWFFQDKNSLVNHILTFKIKNNYVLRQGITKSCAIFQVTMSSEEYLTEELFSFGYLLHEYFLECKGFEKIIKTELILNNKGIFYQWNRNDDSAYRRSIHGT